MHRVPYTNMGDMLHEPRFAPPSSSSSSPVHLTGRRAATNIMVMANDLVYLFYSDRSNAFLLG